MSVKPLCDDGRSGPRNLTKHVHIHHLMPCAFVVNLIVNSVEGALTIAAAPHWGSKSSKSIHAHFELKAYPPFSYSAHHQL